jgi:hypothetical protein
MKPKSCMSVKIWLPGHLLQLQQFLHTIYEKVTADRNRILAMFSAERDAKDRDTAA